MRKIKASVALFAAMVALAAGANEARGQEATKREKEFFRPSRNAYTQRKEGGLAFKALGVGMWVASSGDTLSTEWGLSQAGVYESNPLMKSRALRIGAHAAVPAVMWWATEYLHRKGQRRLALIMRIGVAAAYGYATLHNVRVITSVR